VGSDWDDSPGPSPAAGRAGGPGPAGSLPAGRRQPAAAAAGPSPGLREALAEEG
jgi:hypothetical protein